MRIRRLLGVLMAVALIAPAAPASAAAVGSAGHPGPADAALRSALQGVLDAGATGAIGLVNDGTHVTAVTLGAAQLDPREPIQLRDQVRVGSLTKTVMSTITLQLVGEHRLRLSDTLEHWLPGAVPNGSAITVRMLLNHTSGIYDYAEDPAWLAAVAANPYRNWSPQELIAVANAHPPLFPPGQGAAYSNTAYILLGLILQKVTRQPVANLVWQRIARPLRLTNTYLATSAQFRGPYAHGYFPPSMTGGGYQDTSAWSPSIGGTAGALVSNAPEAMRFYRALLSGRLLSPPLLRAMTTTVATDMPGWRSGLGIFSIETPCGTTWGHEGGIPGYSSIALNDRTGSRSAVILVPTEADDAIGQAFFAAAATAACLMFGRAPTASSRIAGTSSAALR